jgi:hypothetical protein
MVYHNFFGFATQFLRFWHSFSGFDILSQVLTRFLMLCHTFWGLNTLSYTLPQFFIFVYHACTYFLMFFHTFSWFQRVSKYWRQPALPPLKHSKIPTYSEIFSVNIIPFLLVGVNLLLGGITSILLQTCKIWFHQQNDFKLQVKVPNKVSTLFPFCLSTLLPHF